jgi:hypothetical protein
VDWIGFPLVVSRILWLVLVLGSDAMVTILFLRPGQLSMKKNNAIEFIQDIILEDVMNSEILLLVHYLLYYIYSFAIVFGIVIFLNKHLCQYR